MAFRYRLRPTPAHMPGLERHCDCWRRGRRPSPGPAERYRQLAEARNGTWLGEGSSAVQQQALRDFDQALRNWWAGTHRRPAA